MRLNNLWELMVVFYEEVDGSGNRPQNPPKNPSLPPPPGPNPDDSPTPDDPLPGDPGGTPGEDDNDGDGEDEGGDKPSGPTPEELWERERQRLANLFDSLLPVQSPEMLMNNPEDFADEGSETRLGAFLDFVSGEDWQQVYETAVDGARDLFKRVKQRLDESAANYLESNQIEPSEEPDLEPSPDIAQQEILPGGHEAGFGFTQETVDSMRGDLGFLTYLSESKGFSPFDLNAVTSFFDESSADALGAEYINYLVASAQQNGIDLGYVEGLAAQEVVEKYASALDTRITTFGPQIEYYGAIRGPDGRFYDPAILPTNQDANRPALSATLDPITLYEFQRDNLLNMQDTFIHRDVREWAILHDYQYNYDLAANASASEVETALRSSFYEQIDRFNLNSEEVDLNALSLEELTQYYQQSLVNSYGTAPQTSLAEIDPATGYPMPMLTRSSIEREYAELHDLRAAFQGQFEPIHGEEVLLGTLGMAASMFLEPIDWALTLGDVYQNITEGDFGAAAVNFGLAFLPGSLGRLFNRADAFRHLDDFNEFDGIRYAPDEPPIGGLLGSIDAAGKPVQNLGQRAFRLGDETIDLTVKSWGGEYDKLVQQLQQEGKNFTERNIVAIAHNPELNSYMPGVSIAWLEQGRISGGLHHLNTTSGSLTRFQHLENAFELDNEQSAIDFIMDNLANKEPSEITKRFNETTLHYEYALTYEVEKGRKLRIAIGDNGFIISAYPVR